uniref:Toll/interleukin-1 receptor domain-containing protein n=1 Tax=Phenylobacterium glaciei TaxID=2803784 RepID=A0A974SAB6_9CAUL|nr:toll/interleukin-1 receptor domain-containing protein [Phenylobacterium glaciei]
MGSGPKGLSPSSTGIDLGLGIRYSSCVQDWGRPLPDIFLSYSREDQAVARRFAEAFAGQGFDVWWDATLKSGEAYDEVTETALRMARAVVVLWSPRSVMSRWVRAEATLADRNKTLVPCMIEPCERPLMFELTQTAELAHWQGGAEDRVWQGFVADVRRLVERNGRLSRRPRRWPRSSPTQRRRVRPCWPCCRSTTCPATRRWPFSLTGCQKTFSAGSLRIDAEGHRPHLQFPVPRPR